MQSDITSIAALIAAAKADPAKLSCGTYGTGTSAHLAGELFKNLAKVNLTMVPYNSQPAATEAAAANSRPPSCIDTGK